MIHASPPPPQKAIPCYTLATLAAVHHAPPAPPATPKIQKKTRFVDFETTNVAIFICCYSLGSIKPRPHRETHDRGRTSMLITLTRVLRMLILPGPSRRTLLEASFLSEDT